MIGLGAALALFLELGSAAPAASPDAPVRSNREDVAAAPDIVVTGERVRRSLKHTSSSVTVFGAQDFERLASPDRLQQLLEFVPNVQVGSSRDTPTVRGQNSIGVLQGLPGFLGGARPRTTLEVDGRAVSYHEFSFGIFGLWDVERVEVFRSPQTTTQGPNAIAGAIFIETADPTYQPEGRLRAIVGEAHTRELSAALSAPLVHDQLAFRIAGDLRLSHTSSELSGPVEGVNLNRDRYGTVRAKLLGEPAAIPGLRVVLTYSHNQSAAPQIESTAQPVRERRDDHVIYGYFTINEDSVAGTATYAVTPTLQSRSTVTWGNGRIRRFAPHAFGESRIFGRDHSFESVLEWKPAGPVSLVGGVHLLTQDLDQHIDLRAALLGIGAFKDRQHGRGVFGEVEWHPVNRLSVTAGGRYQSDRKVRVGGLSGGVADTPLDFRKDWHAFLPKASLAYDVNRDVRVGAMVMRAYNPGGVSLDLPSRTALTFKPEYLWDYEAFTRASLLGGALTVTGNLFYNAIRDAQRQLDIPLDSPGGTVGLIAVSNAPAARSYGAELELLYTLDPRLKLRAAGGLLATRITRTLSTKDPILDKSFAQAPALTGAAGVDWEPARNLQLSAQVRHNSGYFGDDANTPLLHIAGSTTVDAKASWRVRQFTLYAYAQNLFDEFHMIYWDDATHKRGAANDPRELGVGIEANF
jgi:iron complex outermembrane receptor protein